MVELLASRESLRLQGQAVADGVRNVMLLVRQMREGNYEVSLEGMGVIEALIFANSYLLGDYVDQVEATSAAYDCLGTSSRSFIASVEEVDSEIWQLTGFLVNAAGLLAGARTLAEARRLGSLFQDVAQSIEKRLRVPKPVSDPADLAPSNVVPFARPVGGAA